MRLKTTAAGLAIALAGIIGPLAIAPPMAQASVQQTQVVAKHHAKKHACTTTSSGTCIKGGQFCPQAKYKKSGWDANGRHYVCKGNRTHPHWMK
jgi:hypothetical protein